jgi:MYXO-CTERM domain-containing protein
MGMCVTAPPPMRDAGMVSTDDAGTTGMDAYVVDLFSDAGVDASTNRPDTRRGGCTCEVPSRSSAPSSLAWLSLAALGLLVSRRRR